MSENGIYSLPINFPTPAVTTPKTGVLSALFNPQQEYWGTRQKPWGRWQGKVTGTAGESQGAARQPQGGQETSGSLREGKRLAAAY